MNYGKIEKGAVSIMSKGKKSAKPIKLTLEPKEKPEKGCFYESKWEETESEIIQVWYQEKYEEEK